MKKILFVAVCIACGGGGGNSKYPSRSSGCDVQVFQQAPTSKTENIGPVSASCDDQAATSKDDCLRELKDQACKLGADVVWGVEAEPEHVDGRWKYHGRAAHTATAP
ncbi:MAG TPA: hypothetical protein VH054_20035 [Polyangiaceae bacterium]|jgi:uncharacterized protein YbjQ (UPF0145 family)|nr:hypothetical protein [Polyangiaceae bacterium]